MSTPPDHLQHDLFVLICQLQATENAKELLRSDALAGRFNQYAERLRGQIEASRAVRLDLTAILARNEELEHEDATHRKGLAS